MHIKKRSSIVESLCTLYDLTEGKPFKGKDLEKFVDNLPGYKNASSMINSLVSSGQKYGYLQPLKEGEKEKSRCRSYTWVKKPIVNKAGRKRHDDLGDLEAPLATLRGLFSQRTSFQFRDIPENANDFSSSAWRRLIEKLVEKKVLRKEADANDKRLIHYHWSEKKSASKAPMAEEIPFSKAEMVLFVRLGTSTVVQQIGGEDRIIEELVDGQGADLENFLSQMLRINVLTDVGKGTKGRIFVLNRPEYNEMLARQDLLQQLGAKREEFQKREAELIKRVDDIKNGAIKDQLVAIAKVKEEIEYLEDELSKAKEKHKSLLRDCQAMEKSASPTQEISIGIVKSDLDMVRKRLSLIINTSLCTNAELEDILKLL